MYKIIDTKEEFIDQYFPKYDESGNEIPEEGITIINKIVTTTVEYYINDEIVIVEIPHFNPQSDEDIAIGISNREVTEIKKRGIE
jgi:hypothetical protein